jgi:predicted Zn-dependent peptidase
MRASILLAAAALVASPAIAQTAPAAPPIGTPRPFKMPTIERERLANGMTIAFVPFGSVPQTTLVLTTFAGDLDAPGKPWLPAINADLAKEGAGGLSATQLAEAFSGMGGSLSARADANLTQYSTTVLAERAGDAVTLLGDVMRRPTLAQADFDRVMANRKRALAQAEATPQSMADALLAKALYGSHPYGTPLPTAVQLAGYRLADVKQFHDTQFGARRSTLYVIGQFDKAAVRAAAERAFGSWTAGPPRKQLLARFNAGPKLVLADRPGSEQTTVRLAFAAPAVGSATDVPFRVTDALLGGSFGSRITANIREDKGYTYSPYSNIAGRPGGASWVWSGDITPSVTGKAMAEVFKEIRRLQADPPAAAEAQGMKTYAGSYLLMRTTSADLIAGQLVRADLLGLKPSYFDSYVQRAMAVTPAQISTLAKTDLPIDRLVMVVVGDMKSVEPQLMELPELKRAAVQRVTLPTGK